MNAPSIAVFFTRGMSFQKWDTLGMLKREIALYKEIAASCSKVLFFTYGTGDTKYQKLFPDNVLIVPKIKGIPVLIYSFLIPFIHYKKIKDVKIIKTNQMDGSWAAVIAKWITGAKLIVRCGYEWLQFIERGRRSVLKYYLAWVVEYIAYRAADSIVQTAIGSKDFVVHKFGRANKITLIPNFADTDLFSKDPEQADRVLFVGRLEHQKNIPALISAMEGINMNLVMIGDGSLKEELSLLAQKKFVNIEWKGKLPQSDIAVEFARGGTYVLPSFYEGHPKTLLEAMSAGLACVGSDIPGINDVITDGEDGVLCGTDADSIRKAIMRVKADPAFRAKLGVNARKAALQKYSLSTVVKEELALYHSLLS